jgi:hypothetical protein
VTVGGMASAGAPTVQPPNESTRARATAPTNLFIVSLPCLLIAILGYVSAPRGGVGILARWYKFRKATTGIFTCPHCGAVYEVTCTRSAATDHGEAICVKCRKVMKEWDDAFSRSFRLKH